MGVFVLLVLAVAFVLVGCAVVVMLLSKMPCVDRLDRLLAHRLCHVLALLVPPRMLLSTEVARERPLPVTPCLNKGYVGRITPLALVLHDARRRNKVRH